MHQNKRQLSESDICEKYIRPAMERAGRVVVQGRKARRDAATVLRADYALFHKANIPLVVVEAKHNGLAVGAGMAQAIQYAQLLDVPFSFSSNGDGFLFRDATLADGVKADSAAMVLAEQLWTTLSRLKALTARRASVLPPAHRLRQIPSHCQVRHHPGNSAAGIGRAIP